MLKTILCLILGLGLLLPCDLFSENDPESVQNTGEPIPWGDSEAGGIIWRCLAHAKALEVGGDAYAAQQCNEACWNGLDRESQDEMIPTLMIAAKAFIHRILQACPKKPRIFSRNRSG
ncbi:hypothetical protein ACFL6Y_05275 [Elusimicrobiota bacterium]